MAVVSNQTTIPDAIKQISKIHASYLKSFGWVEQIQLDERMWIHPDLTLGALVSNQTALKLQRQSED